MQPIGENYFQNVQLIKSTPNKKGKFKYKDSTYEYGDNMILFADTSFEKASDFVYVEYGWVDAEKGQNDYKGLDIQGKIVVTIPGSSKETDVDDAFEGFQYVDKKIGFAKERGAIGLLEIFPFGVVDWNLIKGLQTSPQIQLPGSKNIFNDDFMLGIILPNQKTFLTALKEQKTIQNIPFSYQNNSTEEIVYSKNVIGMIKGTDPTLSKEHLVLTAHYDHIGTKPNLEETSDVDTIFNGSRDDAMGTTALLMAAKVIGKKPLKRSVVFAAFTGEENGLLGSQFYVNNPLIPLNQTVFNLNADGTSYNNTSLVTIFGHNQFDDLGLLEKGCQEFDLAINADPAPEQNLFKRSDNFSFAQKGIPAPTFSIGFDNFQDEKVLNYYHQVIDNPNTIDYDYLLRYSQAFSHTARLLGNTDKLPFWKAESEYKTLAESLYEK